VGTILIVDRHGVPHVHIIELALVLHNDSYPNKEMCMMNINSSFILLNINPSLTLKLSFA
jgi:hypothetical protein